jgi:hypothetical protein
MTRTARAQGNGLRTQKRLRTRMPRGHEGARDRKRDWAKEPVERSGRPAARYGLAAGHSSEGGNG